MGGAGTGNRAGSGSGAGAAGRGSGGANAGGAAGEAGSAGEAGADGPQVIDGCADLNFNRTADCTETLADNAAFAQDVTGWVADLDASITWDTRDLLDISGSGSALVTSTKAIDALGDSVVAASQCISVDASEVIEVYANAHIEPGTVAGRAVIGLWLYGTQDCAGDSPSEVFSTADEFTTGQTLTLHGARALTPQLHSVRVRLGVIKPFKAESFAVRFDNVLVRTD